MHQQVHSTTGGSVETRESIVDILAHQFGLSPMDTEQLGLLYVAIKRGYTNTITDCMRSLNNSSNPLAIEAVDSLLAHLRKTRQKVTMGARRSPPSPSMEFAVERETRDLLQRLMHPKSA